MLAVEEGDPPNHLISFHMSRSQQGGPLLGYPLSSGVGLNNSDHLRLGHLPLMLHHLCHISGQALCKKSQEGASQETLKGLEYPGKNPPFHLRINLGWLQNIPAHCGQHLLQ
jgi:hypothetical protein